MQCPFTKLIKLNKFSDLTLRSLHWSMYSSTRCSRQFPPTRSQRQLFRLRPLHYRESLEIFPPAIFSKLQTLYIIGLSMTDLSVHLAIITFMSLRLYSTNLVAVRIKTVFFFVISYISFTVQSVELSTEIHDDVLYAAIQRTSTLRWMRTKRPL